MDADLKKLKNSRDELKDELERMTERFKVTDCKSVRFS